MSCLFRLSAENAAYLHPRFSRSFWWQMPAISFIMGKALPNLCHCSSQEIVSVGASEPHFPSYQACNSLTNQLLANMMPGHNGPYESLSANTLKACGNHKRFSYHQSKRAFDSMWSFNSSHSNQVSLNLPWLNSFSP